MKSLFFLLKMLELIFLRWQEFFARVQLPLKIYIFSRFSLKASFLEVVFGGGSRVVVVNVFGVLKMCLED